MKIIKLKFQKNYSNLEKLDMRPIVAAIGNFDGMHLGHQKLLNQAKKEAKIRKIPFAIISFEPHPRDYFSKGAVNFKITDSFEKQRLIKKFNTEIFVEINFDEKLRSLEPNEFIELILMKILNVKVLFAGENFKFGKNRTGSLIDARNIFKKFDIEPRTCELLQNKNKEVISSEFIRQNIRSCKLEKIPLSLGRFWAVTGKVEHGDKIGSKIGFPTANLLLKEHVEPKFGVYLSNTFIMSDDGQKIISNELSSVSNFGIRPTLNGKKTLFETHILNLERILKDKNLYGKRIYVELKSYLRSEKKFKSVEELKNQIRLDIKNAKDLHFNK